MTEFSIGPLEATDKGYALSSWRESAKAAPGHDRVPWGFFKKEIGALFSLVINASTTKLLGAYTSDQKLLGWLAMTPGKRVHTLHWVQVKFELDKERLRRRGMMTSLLEAAELGTSFVYTCRARRERAALPDNTISKSLDEVLAARLRARGQTASFVPLKEFLR